MPGSRMAHATGLLLRRLRWGRPARRALALRLNQHGTDRRASRAANRRATGRRGGQNLNDLRSKRARGQAGQPEQESVTNMGAVRAALSSGVMVTATVPALPCGDGERQSGRRNGRQSDGEVRRRAESGRRRRWSARLEPGAWRRPDTRRAVRARRPAARLKVAVACLAVERSFSQSAAAIVDAHGAGGGQCRRRRSQ